MRNISVTLHYKDGSIVEYQAVDAFFDSILRAFVLDKEDSSQIIIPLEAIKLISCPIPSWYKHSKQRDRKII